MRRIRVRWRCFTNYKLLFTWRNMRTALIVLPTRPDVKTGFCRTAQATVASCAVSFASPVEPPKFYCSWALLPTGVFVLALRRTFNVRVPDVHLPISPCSDEQRR